MKLRCLSIVSFVLALAVAFVSGTQAQAKQERQTDTPSPTDRALKDLKAYYLAHYKNENGQSSFPNLYNAIGAASGFGTQMGIREAFIKTGKATESQIFVVVKTNSGARYYFGDFLNQPLLESKASVWSIVVGAAQSAGAKSLPDLDDIVRYEAESVGTPQFGVPRTPAPFRANELPIDTLRRDWTNLQTILQTDHVPGEFWGWTIALTAQRFIIERKEDFESGLAAKIVMEAAIPMSKIDPASIGASAN